MNVIYQPKGRALEYSDLACNLYLGCSHGCKYCFAPACMRTSMDNWHSNPHARKNIIAEFKKDAAKLSSTGDQRPILFSFLSDPYQPLEASQHLTRQALEIVDNLKLRCKILTKGKPEIITPDLPLIAHAGVELGVTLSFTNDNSRQEWEPYAASVEERISIIKKAHELGIKTWVSMEPVIIPGEALDLLQILMPYVDLWKIGKLNHYKQIEKDIDWIKFREKAKAILNKHSANYYIKKDLEEYK